MYFKIQFNYLKENIPKDIIHKSMIVPHKKD